MEKLTQIRIKNNNGSYTDVVDIGAAAENVVLSTGFTVEQTIGDIDVGANGSIKTQLAKIIARLAALEAKS